MLQNYDQKKNEKKQAFVHLLLVLIKAWKSTIQICADQLTVPRGDL